MTEYSHWGLCGTGPCDSEGRYAAVPPAPVAPTSAEVVLTGAGEVLVHRTTPPAARCTVAIVIGPGYGTLSRPQSEQMLRTWDIAVDLAKGQTEAVTMLPVSHHWRFSRADYLSLDEWQTSRQGR